MSFLLAQSTAMKSKLSPPATLGSMAVFGRRIIVWCPGCGHQVEPDLDELVERYGAAITELDGRSGFAVPGAAGPDINMVLTGARS